MLVETLITREFVTTPLHEEYEVLIAKLILTGCLVIADEEHRVMGIVTFKDLQAFYQRRKLSDIIMSKPVVSPYYAIEEVFQLMQETGQDILPVYSDGHFEGLITLAAITKRFAELLAHFRQEHQLVIHDLRNPIANVKVLLDAFLSENPHQSNLGALRFCRDSCQHASDILDDLLYLETDVRTGLSGEYCEMNSFYHTCIAEQTGIGRQKNVRFQVRLCSAAYEKLIDRTLLKRAVQNILSNAVKFSYPDSVIKVVSEMRSDRLRLKIADSGIGIPEQLQSEVFKKFTPAGRPGTNREPTVGLGLYFAKSCVEKHGGSIYFKSEEGKGTTFYIEL